jgi:hypothetical protein
MAKITLTGNLFIQLAGESKPAPLPLNLELDYTEKSLVDYVWPANQTNLALSQGTVAAPRFIVVEVTEGNLAPRRARRGQGPCSSTRTPPQVGDSPARYYVHVQRKRGAILRNHVGPDAGQDLVL